MAKNKAISLDLDSSVVEASEVTAAPAVEKTNVKYVKVVKCDKLRVRKEASVDAEVLAIVEKDTQLIFKNKTDGVWSHIQTLTGKDGYVMSEYISK